MVLTDRDWETVRFLYEVDVATADQIKRLVFLECHRSACHRRLAILWRYKCIDRLPRRGMNEPYVYTLSHRATNGLALLRAHYPEASISPSRVNLAKLQHSLELTGCRVAIEKACRASGYLLAEWLREDELLWPLEYFGIQPDGFCRVVRPTADGPRTSGFFIEVERSSKPVRSLIEKIQRYRTLYYEHLSAYEEQFRTRSCRVLFLVGADYGINPKRRIEQLAAICRQAGVTFFRFAPVSDFLAQSPAVALSSSYWRQPNGDGLAALFQPAE
jgi:hypothetical protein